LKFFLLFIFNSLQNKKKTNKALSLSKSSEMIDLLASKLNETTFDGLKEGINGIFDTIANSLIVIYLFFSFKEIIGV